MHIAKVREFIFKIIHHIRVKVIYLNGKWQSQTNVYIVMVSRQ